METKPETTAADAVPSTVVDPVKSEDTTKEPVKEEASNSVKDEPKDEPTTNGEGSVVDRPTAVKTETTTEESKVDPDVVDDVEEKLSEGAEEEEALFGAMEEEDEKEVRAYDQPKDVKAAPTLLRTALEQGQVEPDDSESEDDKKKGEEKKGEEESKTPATPEHHHHARVSEWAMLVIVIDGNFECRLTCLIFLFFAVLECHYHRKSN
jgi:hypothetical protein